MFSSGFTKFKKHWIVTCLHVWALRVYKQKTPKKIPKRRSKSQKQNPKTSIKIPKVYGFCWLRSKAQMARGVCYFLKRNDQTAWDIQPIVFREREIVRDICRLFETNDETVRNIRHFIFTTGEITRDKCCFFLKNYEIVRVIVVLMTNGPRHLEVLIFIRKKLREFCGECEINCRIARDIVMSIKKNIENTWNILNFINRWIEKAPSLCVFL